MNEEKLLVRKIREGTVIDHIKAGNGPKVLDFLNVGQGFGERAVILLMNTESKKLGRKDIVKISKKKLSSKEINKIALVAPDATINLINNFKVVKKEKVKIPNRIKGILECPNPNCITNSQMEQITSKFKVESKRPIKLRCHYCERVFGLREFT